MVAATAATAAMCRSARRRPSTRGVLASDAAIAATVAPCLEATIPTRPAAITTSGKATPHASAARAANSTTTAAGDRTDFRPIRQAASATRATTAGRVPAKAAATSGHEPPAACSHASAVTSSAPGTTKSVPATRPPAIPPRLQPA